MTPVAVSEAQVVDIYADVHINPCTKGVMEQYKQSSKKGTQKAIMQGKSYSK